MWHLWAPGITSASKQRPVSFVKPGHLQRQYSKMANHCQSWGRASTACVQYLPARLKGSLTWPAVRHQRAKGDYFWMFAQNFFPFYRGQRNPVVFFVTQSVQRWRDALLISRRLQFTCIFSRALLTLLNKFCFPSSQNQYDWTGICRCSSTGGTQ